MTAEDPRSLFPDFYQNPAVQALSPVARWTISGQIGTDPDDPASTRKAPIDIRALLDRNWLRGAWSLSDQCLVQLDELTARLPMAANTAFYLRAPSDGLLVIDIEKSCPEEIALQLLGLPGILYTELSMSGRGYHLIAPLPLNFSDHQAAAGARVLREEHGWYEILLDHWVTFTRRPVPRDVLARAQAPEDGPFSSVDDLYAELATNARHASASAREIYTADEPPEIPGGSHIITQTLAHSRHRLKSLDDFGGDCSRYEFSALGTLYRQMLSPMVALISTGHSFSASDQAWLLYQAALQVIPPRPKHNERRNGRAFLLDRAAAMIAQQRSDKNS